MAKFIVEVTKAFKVEASDEEAAFETIQELTPDELDAAYEAAGFFSEITAVYEADASEVCDDCHSHHLEEEL